ncbi:MAG: hypothetical protein RMI91_13455 [Gemmatales bacterium]|nr:hypothetical protein [Gemmatales bacterium]MDW7995652.1 hypothetical protein [Gemmatales bacterium]
MPRPVGEIYALRGKFGAETHEYRTTACRVLRLAERLYAPQAIEPRLQRISEMSAVRT